MAFPLNRERSYQSKARRNSYPQARFGRCPPSRSPSRYKRRFFLCLNFHRYNYEAKSFESLFQKYDRLVLFDTETTGLSAANCEIIEIAACIVSGGKISDQFHCYVNPTQPIPARITELTGIREDMVRDANPIDVELPRFLEFCGSRPLVAHNAGFDMAFVGAACEKLGLTCPSCSVDTVEMARALMPAVLHRLARMGVRVSLMMASWSFFLPPFSPFSATYFLLYLKINYLHNQYLLLFQLIF